MICRTHNLDSTSEHTGGTGCYMFGFAGIVIVVLTMASLCRSSGFGSRISKWRVVCQATEEADIP